VRQTFAVYVPRLSVRSKAPRRRVFVDTRRSRNAAAGGKTRNIDGEFLPHTTRGQRLDRTRPFDPARSRRRFSCVNDVAPAPDTIAAIDLGSNSFHLVVARERDGEPEVVDRIREQVALAEGLALDGSLDAAVQERALACLARFGQRVKGVAPDRLRAVGTSTFRRVRDGGVFRGRAEEALGAEVEVLPGREEARLIYLGVAHTLGDDAGRRLVVDIGGGSTECILGERFESELEESLSMGCVRWSRRFFRKGRIGRKALAKAELAARRELQPVEEALLARGWDQAVGSSGTVLAIAEILRQEGWGDGRITPTGLDALREALLRAGQVDALDLAGLKPERRSVLAGGFVVLHAVFEGLGIESMSTSKGALREGLLYDLLGRIHHEDVRSRSVIAFGARLGIDEVQAARVLETAMVLFDQAREQWQLDDEDRELLRWAAWLHGVGMAVSYSGVHKHGAYLIENTDLPGFSRTDRARLAVLVRHHRRRLRADAFTQFPRERAEQLLRLVLLLRLAVRLHRGRGAVLVPAPRLAVSGAALQLSFPEGWLVGHPLSRDDIAEEAELLAGMGIALTAD
jgi:exopolyphosphatase/guanosine-5'-triphosphate,3'-diphosphate pyrophosphatase